MFVAERRIFTQKFFVLPMFFRLGRSVEEEEEEVIILYNKKKKSLLRITNYFFLRLTF